MRRFVMLISLLSLALPFGSPAKAQNPAASPERESAPAAQSRLVVFETFMRAT